MSKNNYIKRLNNSSDFHCDFSYPLSKIAIIILIALFFLPANGLKGQIFKADTGYAEVKGTNGITSYTGKSNQLQGTINMKKGSVNFTLPLKTLKTGNSIRDNHMLNTLEADKFPKTKFSGEVRGNFPKNGRSKKVTAKGQYTIHGETKTIKVEGTIQNKGNQLRVKAEFPIKITAYGMEKPGFWFAEIHDKHKIAIRVTLMKEKP